jgi:uncharacterized protein YaeQ
VIIYTYSRRAADAWWRQNSGKFSRFGNLKVIQLDAEGDAAAMAERSMQLQALIQDGELLLSDDRDRQLKITRESWA